MENATSVTLPGRHHPATAREAQWVVTCANDAVYEDCLVPFLGSLVSLAKWDGSIAVFDYGLSRRRADRLREWGFLVEPAEPKSHVVTVDRFLHLGGFADRHGGLVGHWDCDIWFPGSLSELFDHYPSRHPGKLVCNLDHVFQPSNFTVAKNPHALEKLKRILHANCQKHGQLLQCGFFCGAAQAVAGYCRYLEAFIQQGDYETCWNTDTVALNYYYFEDPDRFAIIDNKYNFLPDCLPFPVADDFSFEKLGIRGFHVTSPWRAAAEGRRFLFQNRHPKLYELWKETLNR